MKMDNRLIWNHPLFPPVLISIISLLGICVILATTWLPRQRTQAIPTETVTSFKYLLLATEMVFSSSKHEGSTPSEILSTPTAASENKTTPLLVMTQPTGISTADPSIPTITITPPPQFGESNPMTMGTYDDADSTIIRHGNWEPQKKADAYKQTLLVSNTVGNYVAFSFIGRFVVLGYQSTNDIGNFTINIDGSEQSISQVTDNAWFSRDLGTGTHFVLLTHASGTTVNLDYINIPN